MPQIEFIENWYAEPFTKRQSCQIPGQCGGDCDCGCPYNTMAEAETLPLIAELADMFPNEWLAFIVSPAEDDDPVPTHGKLVAHSPHPDEIFDAVNAVLWNQCVYTFFNGNTEMMFASYGDSLKEEVTVQQPVMVFPHHTPFAAEPVPERLLDLVYSALEKLYRQPPQLNEAIRRLRLAKVRASFNLQHPLNPLLDRALNSLEVPLPVISDAIWNLEEGLSEVELVVA